MLSKQMFSIYINYAPIDFFFFFRSWLSWADGDNSVCFYYERIISLCKAISWMERHRVLLAVGVITIKCLISSEIQWQRSSPSGHSQHSRSQECLCLELCVDFYLCRWPTCVCVLFHALFPSSKLLPSIVPYTAKHWVAERDAYSHCWQA